MVEKILDNVSYGLIRTNPKLTGNVKLVVDSKDTLYLESFSSNITLSAASFKAFKIDPKSSYEKDVFRFFENGNVPKNIAYEAFQQYEDIAVLDSYGSQYEMFYDYGSASIASESYTEDLGLLAPLWLNEQIPNYFVIFRLDDPVAVNNKDASSSSDGEENAQTSKHFNENVLENCTAIKTFDLRETSNIGSYLRNYRNNIDFPAAPLTTSWRVDEPFEWSGISYDKGGFITKGEYAYEGLVTHDGTIIQDEYFITQGFQRTGVLVANLINLQFLFTDEDADDYSFNRYFGLYVNAIDEGKFDLSGEGFYKDKSKAQTPDITSITEVSAELNTPLEIQNPYGIKIFLDPPTITTSTGIPTPKRVDEVESIFYVKDKEDSFHTIKKGSNWGKNQLRLFDKKLDVSLLTGYKQPKTFAQSIILEEKGQAMASFKIEGTMPVGYRIRFYDGNQFIDEIAADTSYTNGPGTSYEQFFNPNGTPQEIAKALASAINGGIPEGERYFDASYNDNTAYVRSRYGGSRFNQLRFEMDDAIYPEAEISTYPSTASSASSNFIGGSNIKNAQLRVDFGAKDRFTTDRFVKTKGNWAGILSYTPYLEEPVYDPTGNNIIAYTDIDKYSVIQLDEDQVFLTSTGQAAVYVDFRPSFGRFSFFPLRDFDFDFFSERYSREGELAYEYAEYNQYIQNTSTNFDFIGLGSNPDVREFYNDGGFAELLGLLRAADPDTEEDSIVASEYDRLEENFIKTQSVASRITPYINKWCYYHDGKDVRNHPYRLNVSESFGSSNFAPSIYDHGQYPFGFSHEWYYLCEIPEYFSKEALEVSWSYFNEAPTDEIEADPIAGTPYIPGTFQKVTTDGFTDYFLVDNFDWKGNIVLIDKQLRWGTFIGGDEDNYAQTFLRGTKVVVKPKADPSVKPNFNAQALSYVRNGNFNEYKFSAIVVPNVPNKPDIEIKFINNEKWKTLTMVIFLKIDWDFLDGGRPSIDRTSLYSLHSQYKHSGTEITPDDYTDTFMQGAIALSTSVNHGSYYEIRGMEDQYGNPTQFTNDVKLGADGSFCNIEWTVGSNTYLLSNITSVESDDILYCQNITGTAIPTLSPSPSQQRAAVYKILGGGFNAYVQNMISMSFADITYNVNSGNPNIIYETIDKEGNKILNDDGSLAETFMIHLSGQDAFLKSIYVGVLPDPEKPTIFNLTDIIGYDLSLQTTPRVVPFSRHSGNYEPMTYDLFKFRDPYLNIDFNGGGITGAFTGTTGGGNVIPDEMYKIKVLDKMRYANTQFYSNDDDFGQIHRFFYHKVNIEDPSTILELSTQSAFKSLYPLINEIGIDYRDFYIFSSNWDPGYFRKSIDKAVIQSIIGTRSMLEKKSFLGSKYIKVPAEVSLQIFEASEFSKAAVKQPSLVEGTFVHREDNVKIELYLFIQKKLIEVLFQPIYDVFFKFINPLYGVGNLTSIDDDVRYYIIQNILPLYKITNVELFTRALRSEEPTDYSTAELDDAAKFEAGLTVTDNFSSILLNTNQFDTRLIYNKRSGYSEQIGLSVTLEKK